MSKSGRRARPHGWTAWLGGVLIVGAVLSGASASVDAAGATVPSAPKITMATPGLHSVTVAFWKPTSTGGAAILSYRATCTSGNGGVSGWHQGFHSPITVTGLSATKSYRCTVTAQNKVGTGPASAPSTAVVSLPTVPPAPVITAVTPGFHNVTVAFKSTGTGGAEITGYRVTCGGNYGPRSHQGFKSPITIACVAGAEEYTCTVAADNRIGWSHASAPSDEVISLPITPGPPKITSVTAGSHSALVAFTKPANDGGVRVSNYRVTCTSSNGGVPGAHQGTKSPITVAGLSPARTYTCTVAAINQVSTGPASTASIPIVTLSH